jgi:hypothetical protein
MLDDWTGRDAYALQSALRMSNQELAAYLGIGQRTVADWHAKPGIRPRPETQRILDTALEQASAAVRERFATLTDQPRREGSADEGQPAGVSKGGAGPRSVMIGTNVGIIGAGNSSGVPEFGRLLLPRIVGLRDFHDSESERISVTRSDASILFYLIEHFVRVGAVDVAINEGIYDGAIPTLPGTFRSRLVEIDRADSAQSVLQICEPIAGELGVVIGASDDEIDLLTYRSSMPDVITGALATLVFELCDYIRGMRHGLIVTLNLLAMRKAINILLETVSRRESRANLVTVEQVFSTYQSHEIGAPVIKSMAPARMIEIFDDLITNPLYRDLSHHAANMGTATESVESVAAVTRAAKRLVSQDASLNFSQYDAFIASGRRGGASNRINEHFNSKYFPPIVPIGDAYVKAEAAWRRDAPAFIPLARHPERRIIGPRPGVV